MKRETQRDRRKIESLGEYKQKTDMVLRFLGNEGFLRVGFAGLLSSTVDLAMNVRGLSLSKVRNRDKEIRSSDPHIMHKFSSIKTIELSRQEASQLHVKKESNGNKIIKRRKQNKRLKKGQDRLKHVNASL